MSNSRITRVSNNQMTNQILRNVQSQLNLQDRLFQQISSGKQVQKPSDNPIATGKIMNVNGQLQRNTEYQNTINMGNVWTNVTTTALSSAVDAWRRVEELTVSAADGTKSAGDLKAIGEELDQLLQHLVQVSNSENAGSYIFGGSKTKTPPFTANINASTGRISGVFYDGNVESRDMRSSQDSQVSVNVLGSSGGDPSKKGVFIDDSSGVNAFTSLIELRDKLLNNDFIGISGSGGYLEQIQKASRSLTSAQVRVGGAQETLNLDLNRLTQESSDLESFLSKVEDVDVAKAIMQLNNVQNVYEAALAAGGRVMQTTLLKYI